MRQGSGMEGWWRVAVLVGVVGCVQGLLTVGVVGPLGAGDETAYVTQGLVLHAGHEVHVVEHGVRAGAWRVNNSLLVSRAPLASYFRQLRQEERAEGREGLHVSLLLLGDAACSQDASYYGLATHVYRTHACAGLPPHTLLPTAYRQMPPARWWRGQEQDSRRAWDARQGREGGEGAAGGGGAAAAAGGGGRADGAWMDGERRASYAFVGHAGRQRTSLLRAAGWQGWEGLGGGRGAEAVVHLGPHRLPQPTHGSAYGSSQGAAGGGLSRTLYYAALASASCVLADGHATARQAEALAAGALPVGRRTHGPLGDLLAEAGAAVQKPRLHLPALLARMHSQPVTRRDAAARYVQLLQEARRQLAHTHP